MIMDSVFPSGAHPISRLAASEYYVVQDVKTKKCTIIDKKPTDESKAFVNAAGTVYRTRSEAAIGMKSVKVCKSDYRAVPSRRLVRNIGISRLGRTTVKDVLYPRVHE
jgi:hypothetical protein